VQIIRKLVKKKIITNTEIKELLEVRKKCNRITQQRDLDHIKLVQLNTDHANCLLELIEYYIDENKSGYSMEGFKCSTKKYPMFENLGGQDRCDELMIYEWLVHKLT